jgi:hypothetical protein
MIGLAVVTTGQRSFRIALAFLSQCLLFGGNFGSDCYLFDRNNIAQTKEISNPNNTKANNESLPVIMNTP